MGLNTLLLYGRLKTHLYYIVIINIYVMPSRRCVGPRGAAMWPRVPRRIHVGPAREIRHFLLFFYLFKTF